MVIQKDITEQKQAELNFRNSLDSSPLGIRIADSRGELIYVNQVMLDMYGYNNIDEMRNIPTSKRLTPESYAEYLTTNEKLKKGESIPSEFGLEIIRKDGEIRNLLSTRKEVIWDGKVQFQYLCQDITERKKAEEALHIQEEQYRLVVENANQGLAVVQDRIIRFCNPKVTEILGYPFEELSSRPFGEFIHPDDREVASTQHMRRLEGKEIPTYVQYRMIRKNGDIRWIETNALIIEWEGRPATLGFISDITEQKQIEDVLKESEEKFRLLAENSLMGTFIIQDNKMVYINPTFAELFGYEREEIVDSMSPSEFIHPDDLQVMMKDSRIDMKVKI